MNTKPHLRIKIEEEDLSDSNRDKVTTLNQTEYVMCEVVKCEAEETQVSNVTVKIEDGEGEEIEDVNGEDGENLSDNENIPNDLTNEASDNEANNSRYTCKFCQTTFVLKRFYENHYKYCQTKYISKFGNFVEIYKSIEEKRFSCEECGYSSNEMSSLKRHMFTHCRVKPYQCSHCDYSAIQKVSVQRHENYKHNPKKVYDCEKCLYKCVNIRDLKRHEMVHSQKKPYACHICQKGFSKNLYLIAHMYKHTGQQKPYQCNLCSYHSSYEVNLKKHVISKHTEIKAYVCDECKLKFALPETLKKHKYLHLIDKPFKCKECRAEFCSKTTLTIHVKKKHSTATVR